MAVFLWQYNQFGKGWQNFLQPPSQTSPESGCLLLPALCEFGLLVRTMQPKLAARSPAN
jgi:hypothetical protein